MKKPVVKKNDMLHREESFRREEGQALIETALVLPVLLLLLFGIIEFGIALARFQVVTNAAREGARAAALFRANCTDANARQDARAAIGRFSNRLGITELPFTLDGDGANLCESRTLTVTVSFEQKFPIVSAFAKSAGFPSAVVLRQTTTAFNENTVLANR